MGVNSTNESGKPNNQKQKSHSRKLLRRNVSSNRPSCKNDAAKIQFFMVFHAKFTANYAFLPLFLALCIYKTTP